MKKVLSILVVVCIVSALLILPTSAKGTVTKVWFEGEHVEVRASDDPSQLCDNKILSEENATAKDHQKDGIVLVHNTNMNDTENNTVATLYFELDSLQSIDSVYITWYVFHNAIIGLPVDNNLIIGYSQDGQTYIEIGAYDFEGEADPDTSFQLETTIRLGQTVKAKYVSVSFEYGPHGQDGWWCPMWEWIGFTEVGAGMMVDEVIDGGYDEVSEDNTPLDQIEPIVPIPEGYTALKHAKFNQSITTGSYTIITDPASMHDFNVVWTSCALLRPTETEGEYSVVAVQWLNGDNTFMFADAEEGDIVLSVHGDDAADGSQANRQALTALVAGDIVTFAGYNFEESSFETGAVVYFINNTLPAAGGDDVSDDVSEPADESKPADESEPAEDSETADESEENVSSADSSAPIADDDDSNGGNTGLIIGIVIAVIAVIAIVVVVVVIVKKKK